MNNVTENTRKIIGCRINELLAINDVKQKELAAYLSISDNIVSYFVKGTRVPNTEQIIKIANFFNVSSDYLLGLTDVKTTDTDLKMIVDYTGLSEECVEMLNSIQCETALWNEHNTPPFLRNSILIQRFAQTEFISVLTMELFPLATSFLSDIQEANKLSEYCADYGSELYDKYIFLCAKSKSEKLDIIEKIHETLTQLTNKWLTILKAHNGNPTLEDVSKYTTDVKQKINARKALAEHMNKTLSKHTHERSGGNGKHTREKK